MEHPGTSTQIRVMAFNIEDGGEGVDLGKVVEAIRLADPDLVALEEAMGNSARIARALGWGFASARHQVISRHPILEPGGADGTCVLVEILPGGVVAVANVHLPAEPYGPELALRGGSSADVVALERRIRLPKLERRLSGAARLAAAGMPGFLLGDFNTPSHLDWTAGTVGLRPHVRAVVDWPVSRAIEAAGFRDSWREIHPDPVADPGLTWWADRPPTGGYEPGPDTPNDRIDYIYAAGPSTTLDSRIVGETGRPDVSIGVAPWPSDHRAVVSTFDVTPAPVPADTDTAATRVPIVEAQPSHDVRLRLARSVVRVGDPIEVSWRGGPAYRWDWIAVFAASGGALADAHLIWAHTGAISDGSLSLDAESAVVDQSPVGGHWPLPPGDYVVAYLLDDSARALARAPLTIVP